MRKSGRPETETKRKKERKEEERREKGCSRVSLGRQRGKNRGVKGGGRREKGTVDYSSKQE